MSTPPLHALNLNALVALDALLTECNVTRAARRVRITQPAMSQALARLRELFDDPLLVRTGKGLVRSPRGEAMLVPLAEALRSVERAIHLGMGFDPKTSSRIFRVAMTDLHLALILPGVLHTMEEHAPELRIQAESTALTGLADKISSGEVDLAVGFLLRATAGLRAEVLFADDFVCLVRRGHKLGRRKRIAIEDYAKSRHLANTPVGFVPRELSAGVLESGSRSSIRASLPYLLALPAIVRRTDYIGTVPRRLLKLPIDLDDIVIVEAPLELPAVEHSMWWHPRFDRDPAHQWLREQVRNEVR